MQWLKRPREITCSLVFRLVGPIVALILLAQITVAITGAASQARQQEEWRSQAVYSVLNSVTREISEEKNASAERARWIADDPAIARALVIQDQALLGQTAPRGRIGSSQGCWLSSIPMAEMPYA